MKLTNKTLFWAKAHPDTIIPTKKDEDAGYDIYARFDQDYITIQPNETKMIPTDLHCAITSDYVLILKERGSTGSKGLGQRCGVIDSGFRGSIFVPITNYNAYPVVIGKKHVTLQDVFGDVAPNGTIIYPYEKAVCQGVLQEVPKLLSMEIELDELLNIESERGQGMLGDSGK